MSQQIFIILQFLILLQCSRIYAYGESVQNVEIPKLYGDSLTHTDVDPEFKFVYRLNTKLKYLSEAISQFRSCGFRAHFCTALGGIPTHKLDEYRIDRRTYSCHSILKGEEGPCGSNMLFYPQLNNTVYGNCDCKDKTRLLIFHEETNQCYPIFSKGYCPSGKWLTLSRSSKQPICEPNPCQDLMDKTNIDVVLLDNQHCEKLGIGSPNCIGEIRFVYGKILPRCLPPSTRPTTTLRPYYPSTQRPGGGGGSIFKPLNQLESCPLASFRSLSGNCQPSWEW